MKQTKKTNVRKQVRQAYGKIAKKEQCGCGCSCDPSANISKQIGYSKEELATVPEGANLDLGCGNPVALASLKEGETVIDLGSGGGLDCFLASKKVGATGKIIGVDMTAEMLDKARANCKKGNYKNVEFRLGEIENLPVADNTADVIISNCVINLSPDKQRVFNEAFRVLKPNGRLMVSDMVLVKPLPDAVTKNVNAYIGCIAGAEQKNRYLDMIRKAGFKQVQVIQESQMPLDSIISDPPYNAAMKQLKITVEKAREIFGSVVSIQVSAIKR